MNWLLHSYIKKGYKDKSGLKGPLRGKQLQMCKERNILRGWPRMHTAVTAVPLSINRYTNIHCRGGRQTEMDRTPLWQYLQFHFSQTHSFATVSGYKRKHSLQAPTKNIKLHIQSHWTHVDSYSDVLLHNSSPLMAGHIDSDAGWSLMVQTHWICWQTLFIF